MRLPIRFDGATVVVTGSTRGLGRHIADAFAAAGAQVGINGRSSESVDAVVTANPAFFAATGDLSDAGATSRLADRLAAERGRLDVLVCNAGGGRPDPERRPDDEWRRVLDMNLMSAVNAVETLLPIVKEGEGAVCIVTSIAGVRPSGAPAAYAAAKAALNSYVRSAAAAAAYRAIRVNGLAPGNLLFEGSTWQERLDRDPRSVEDMLRERVPLRRLGAPDEIANWCLFLCSPYSSFSTGSIHVVDGGQLA